MRCVGLRPNTLGHRGHGATAGWNVSVGRIFSVGRALWRDFRYGVAGTLHAISSPAHAARAPQGGPVG